MIDYRLNSIFNEIDNSLEDKGLADSIQFEETDDESIKVLCVDQRRVGKLAITYPDRGRESIDCCYASINFEFYLKDDDDKFDIFIEKLCSLSKAR